MSPSAGRHALISDTGLSEQRPMMPLDAQEWNKKPRLTLNEEQRASAALWLVVLVAAAVGLRLLIFALGPMGDLSLAADPASARYLALAHHLAEEQTFALNVSADDGLAGRVNALRHDAGEIDATSVATGMRMETYRTPGYPAFLAIFEWTGLGGKAVLLTQCLLGAGCVVLVYRLTLALLHSPRGALVAAGIMALHPASVAATNVMLPDVLWLTLVLAGLWMVVGSDSNLTGSLAIGGVMLGLAALVQPYALVVVTLLAMWLCLRNRDLRTVGAVVVLLVMAALPAGAWIGRNYAIGFGPHLSSRPVIDGYFHTLGDMRRAAGQDGSVDALAADLAARRTPNETVLHAMERLRTEAIGTQSGLYLATLQRNAMHLFTDHSLASVYRQLGIAYNAPPVAHHVLTGGLSWRAYSESGDAATLGAALAWTTLNALLLLAALVGLIIMVVRGKWLAALLLVGLLGFAVADLHSGLYGRPQLTALAFQAALVAGLLAPGKPRKAKVKLTREEKRIARMRKRQEQTLGFVEPEPLPAGPRGDVRPI